MSKRSEASRRVLILEDDEASRTELQSLFTEAGHSAQVAENGLTGLAALEGFRPQIAIVDLMMPVMDGYAFARQVRKTMGTGSPLLIAYSASAVEAVALAAGFDQFLPKTCKIEELLRVVERFRP